MKVLIIILLLGAAALFWYDSSSKRAALEKAQQEIAQLTDERDKAKAAVQQLTRELQVAQRNLAPLPAEAAKRSAPAASQKPDWFQEQVQQKSVLQLPSLNSTPAPTGQPQRKKQ